MPNLIRRLRYLLKLRNAEAELREELEFHRAERQRQLERDGIPSSEAAPATRRLLGNLTLAYEDSRAVWVVSWLERLWQDIRYGCRGLIANVGFSCLVLVALSLGIGANVAIFTVIRAVMLRPLAFADPSRLVMLSTDDVKRGLHEEPTALLTIEDWRAQSRRFSDMAAFRGAPFVVLSGETPDRVLGEFVSSNFFSLLGVGAAIGRNFLEEEQRSGDPVVVLSYGLWQRHFGGSPDVLGKVLALDQRTSVEQLRIIGVMPSSFSFPNRDVQFWRPIVELDRQRQERFRFIGRSYDVVARLRPGATVDDAQSEMIAIGRRLEALHPPTDPTFPGFTASVVPLSDYYTGRPLRAALWILLAAAGAVLLTACVNVANLLLARGSARSRELAIRSSLGAGRVRLLGQLLTETAILAAAAAAGGLMLAGAALRALVGLAPPGIYPATSSSYTLTDSVRVLARSSQPGIPRLDEISIDPAVLSFAIGLAIATALLFGAIPAWRMSHVDPIDALKGGPTVPGRTGIRRRVGSLLVVVQCALAVMLLSGAGLLIRSLDRVRSVHQGFRADHVLLVRVSLTPSASRTDSVPVLGADVMKRREFYKEAIERVRNLPGVQNAGILTDLLVRGHITGSIIINEGVPVPVGTLGFANVGPGLFETLDVPLIRGRFFSDDDVVTQIRLISTDLAQIESRKLTWPVIVNETFVRRFLSDVDPLSARIRLDREVLQVVGVVGDMRREGPERPAIAEFFRPYIGQTSEMAVRTSSEPLALAPAIREVIRAVNHQGMVLNATSLERRLAEFGAPRDAQTWLLTAFAALALVLAAIGIYGIVRYRVAERRREIAIRIAIGARPSDVFREVVGQGIAGPLLGVTVGLMCAAWLTHVMSHLLFEISPTDPLTFASVGSLLVCVGLLACWIPARRASHVDPIEALRCE